MWATPHLAQFQVQAGLEVMGGRDVDRHVLQAELDLPDDAMRQALGAEVSRGAARRTTSALYRSIREDADVMPEEWS